MNYFLFFKNSKSVVYDWLYRSKFLVESNPYDNLTKIEDQSGMFKLVLILYVFLVSNDESELIRKTQEKTILVRK